MKGPTFSRVYTVAAVAATLLLSACVQTHEFLGDEVPQVQQYDPSWQTIKEYVRTMTPHKGFETRACFDFLWMSDRMRHIYCAMHQHKIGQNPTGHKATLLRQLEENKHKIIIYVLAEVTDAHHVSLSDPQSVWSFYLQTPNGYRIEPLSVKEVSLDSEIRAMFHHRATPSKKSYKLTFAAKDLSGRKHFNVHDEMQLVAATARMSEAVSWVIPSPLKSEAITQEYALRSRSKSGGIFGRLKEWGTQYGDDDFFW